MQQIAFLTGAINELIYDTKQNKNNAFATEFCFSKLTKSLIHLH